MVTHCKPNQLLPTFCGDFIYTFHNFATEKKARSFLRIKEQVPAELIRTSGRMLSTVTQVLYF